nr:hypothetical protein [Tanacetum cinerariifolium]
MVAYLTKSDASEGFDQIIDFLNGCYIKYALTINPNIYMSCIKQFWNTVVIKQVNDVTRLQALVDKKKVVIIEAAITEVLRLDDVKRVDFLPKEIFAELARMGYEKPSPKLTFYKAFFSSQWKFLIHTILQSLSAKRDDTTAQGNDAQEPFIPSPTPPTPPPKPPQDLPSTSQTRVKKLEKGNRVKLLKLRRLKKVGTSQRVDTLEDTVMDDASNQGRIIDDLDKDDAVSLMDDKEEDKKEEEAKEVVYVVTIAKLITEVVTTASETIIAASIIIFAAEPQIPATTITAALIRVAATPKKPKPLKKKQQVKIDEEYARKLHAELNKDINRDVAIEHVKQNAKEDPAVQRYQVMKKKPQTEAQDRKNMIMYLKNVAGFILDYFKGMSYDDIRPIFEVKFNSNIEFLLKTKEQMEEEKSRALQSINETPSQKAAKRRKLNEEVEDLKRNLEIMSDEDDNVYTEVTPLARKVPVVGYEIINLNNKPYYKIIQANGTHQLYISFLTLLKNFDREDLEDLWSLVKERFSTSKPKNFSDDFLLTTLGAMFKEPDGQAQV